MKILSQIVGVIVLIIVIYWFVFVAPQRKECINRASQNLSNATTNYQEGLIDVNAYKIAQNMFDVQNKACFK